MSLSPMLPLPLLTPAQMRAWDERAVRELGIPERLLMEIAGRAAARVLHRCFPRGRVAALFGRGNNGGDALVLLRTLRAWGRDVVAIPVGGAEVRADLCHGWDLPVADVLADGRGDGSALDAALCGADVLVDGILGTGAVGAPRPPAAAAVRALNAAGRPVLALDGPTGVDLGDGSISGEAVRACVTVTFGAPKRGLVRFPGRAHAGRIVVVETGFPPLRAEEYDAALATMPWARSRLPPIAPDAHKGTAGTVAVLAGRHGLGGAAILVATGALRAGAGLARVVTAEENRLALHAALPEAVFTDRSSAEVDDALSAADAVVVGPGMGTDAAAQELLHRVLGRCDTPVLLDADALTLLARDPALLPADRPHPLLLTPHPGEMARLLDTDVPAVTRDPFAAARQAAQSFGCAVLLKGAPSVVAAPGAPVLVNVAGHSGVATGGMGDTLAGVAGALLALGAGPQQAGALALLFAGRAAELAGRGRSLLPTDVADALPRALAGAESQPEALAVLPDVVWNLPPAR